MSKLKQKIVLFIEPARVRCSKPSKIGNLFRNRFAFFSIWKYLYLEVQNSLNGFDENAKNEILKIYQLEYRFPDLDKGGLTLEEGPDLINYRIACDS